MMRWLRRFFPTGKIDNLWVEPRCDVCGVLGEEAEIWCGNCGCCHVHCQEWKGCLTECQECGEMILPDDGCWECDGKVISVSFPGYGGSYWQPPEPAEGVIWCPRCQDEVDAQFEWETAWCAHDHEVTINEPDEEVR